eukprot:scaffold41174_cov66-Phaeocystis_antarctica.AAC.1
MRVARAPPAAEQPLARPRITAVAEGRERRGLRVSLALKAAATFVVRAEPSAAEPHTRTAAGADRRSSRREASRRPVCGDRKQLGRVLGIVLALLFLWAATTALIDQSPPHPSIPLIAIPLLPSSPLTAAPLERLQRRRRLTLRYLPTVEESGDPSIGRAWPCGPPAAARVVCARRKRREERRPRRGEPRQPRRLMVGWALHRGRR